MIWHWDALERIEGSMVLGGLMAGLGDSLTQMLLVTVLAALCGGGIATGLIMRFWAPTLKRVAASLDHDQRRRRTVVPEGRAPRALEDTPPPRRLSHPTDAGAVRELVDLTESLDHQALALRTLARRITAESTPGAIPIAMVQATGARAEDLARTADQARQALRRVSHLLAGSEEPLGDHQTRLAADPPSDERYHARVSARPARPREDGHGARDLGEGRDRENGRPSPRVHEVEHIPLRREEERLIPRGHPEGASLRREEARPSIRREDDRVREDARPRNHDEDHRVGRRREEEQPARSGDSPDRAPKYRSRFISPRDPDLDRAGRRHSADRR